MNFRSEVYAALRDGLDRPDMAQSIRLAADAEDPEMKRVAINDLARRLTERVVLQFPEGAALPRGTTTV